MAKENPFDLDTPEWQLWENMLSSRRASQAFAEDATRFQQKSADQRAKEARYAEALTKLGWKAPDV